MLYVYFLILNIFGAPTTDKWCFKYSLKVKFCMFIHNNQPGFIVEECHINDLKKNSSINSTLLVTCLNLDQIFLEKRYITINNQVKTEKFKSNTKLKDNLNLLLEGCSYRIYTKIKEGLFFEKVEFKNLADSIQKSEDVTSETSLISTVQPSQKKDNTSSTIFTSKTEDSIITTTIPSIKRKYTIDTTISTSKMDDTTFHSTLSPKIEDNIPVMTSIFKMKDTTTSLSSTSKVEDSIPSTVSISKIKDTTTSTVDSSKIKDLILHTSIKSEIQELPIKTSGFKIKDTTLDTTMIFKGKDTIPTTTFIPKIKDSAFITTTTSKTKESIFIKTPTPKVKDNVFIRSSTSKIDNQNRTDCPIFIHKNGKVTVNLSDEDVVVMVKESTFKLKLDTNILEINENLDIDKLMELTSCYFCGGTLKISPKNETTISYLVKYFDNLNTENNPISMSIKDIDLLKPAYTYFHYDKLNVFIIEELKKNGEIFLRNKKSVLLEKRPNRFVNLNIISIKINTNFIVLDKENKIFKINNIDAIELKEYLLNKQKIKPNELMDYVFFKKFEDYILKQKVDIDIKEMETSEKESKDIDIDIDKNKDIDIDKDKDKDTDQIDILKKEFKDVDERKEDVGETKFIIIKIIIGVLILITLMIFILIFLTPKHKSSNILSINVLNV